MPHLYLLFQTEDSHPLSIRPRVHGKCGTQSPQHTVDTPTAEHRGRSEADFFKIPGQTWPEATTCTTGGQSIFLASMPIYAFPCQGSSTRVVVELSMHADC